jgi:hypothetical protein
MNPIPTRDPSVNSDSVDEEDEYYGERGEAQGFWKSLQSETRSR